MHIYIYTLHDVITQANECGVIKNWTVKIMQSWLAGQASNRIYDVVRVRLFS